ncbi:MAG TPA: hypothetical protein VMH77_00230 [Steroidobacteraceae bacterium]|nr:hypothetical protein [Steroidobacteraceae bacterium]
MNEVIGQPISVRSNATAGVVQYLGRRLPLGSLLVFQAHSKSSPRTTMQTGLSATRRENAPNTGRPISTRCAKVPAPVLDFNAAMLFTSCLDHLCFIEKAQEDRVDLLLQPTLGGILPCADQVIPTRVHEVQPELAGRNEVVARGVNELVATLSVLFVLGQDVIHLTASLVNTESQRFALYGPLLPGVAVVPELDD